MSFLSKIKEAFSSKKPPQYKIYQPSELKMIAMKTRVVLEKHMQDLLKQIRFDDKQFQFCGQDPNKLYNILKAVGDKVIEVETIKILMEMVKKIQAGCANIIMTNGDVARLKTQIRWFQCVLWYKKTKQVKYLQDLYEFCFNFFKGYDVTAYLNVKCDVFQIYPVLNYLETDQSKPYPLQEIIPYIQPYVSCNISQSILDAIFYINSRDIKKQSVIRQPAIKPGTHIYPPQKKNPSSASYVVQPQSTWQPPSNNPYDIRPARNTLDVPNTNNSYVNPNFSSSQIPLPIHPQFSHKQQSSQIKEPQSSNSRIINPTFPAQPPKNQQEYYIPQNNFGQNYNPFGQNHNPFAQNSIFNSTTNNKQVVEPNKAPQIMPQQDKSQLPKYQPKEPPKQSAAPKKSFLNSLMKNQQKSSIKPPVQIKTIEQNQKPLNIAGSFLRQRQPNDYQYQQNYGSRLPLNNEEGQKFNQNIKTQINIQQQQDKPKQQLSVIESQDQKQDNQRQPNDFQYHQHYGSRIPMNNVDRSYFGQTNKVTINESTFKQEERREQQQRLIQQQVERMRKQVEQEQLQKKRQRQIEQIDENQLDRQMRELQQQAQAQLQNQNQFQPQLNDRDQDQNNDYRIQINKQKITQDSIPEKNQIAINSAQNQKQAVERQFEDDRERQLNVFADDDRQVIDRGQSSRFSNNLVSRSRFGAYQGDNFSINQPNLPNSSLLNFKTYQKDDPSPKNIAQNDKQQQDEIQSLGFLNLGKPIVANKHFKLVYYKNAQQSS